MQSILESGTASVEWVQHEFSGIRLGDQRLERRLIRTAELLAQAPLSPINEACGSWADTQAAYRLFDNVKTRPGEILAPHIRATRERVRSIEGPVLVVQDTVFFSYGRHPKTKGLGPIGNSNSVHERGLIMHTALAFTPAGVPLGIVSENIWARDAVPEEGYQEKIERLQVTAIEEKESFKWLLALRDSAARLPWREKLITVADRESDFWEFLTEAKETGAHFLVRARVDRQLIAEDSACCASLLEALTEAEVLGEKMVYVPGNGQRQARSAQLEVRVAQVTIKPPQRRGRAKASASTEPLAVTVIGASERNAPEGAEAISWVLLTDLAVAGFDSACEKVNWYGKRFGIETWHKVLKSGCKVEDCLLETAERLRRYLTLFSILAVRLMHVAYLAREHPELPAMALFSGEELEALYLQVNQTLPPADPPTLRQAVRLLGRLGGHLGRKGDGEPGMTVIWRGWMRLYTAVPVLRAYKNAAARIDSS